ncbi:MAG: hypothetical protein QOI34_14, partial [Verrucomicrobiota bacterium]
RHVNRLLLLLAKLLEARIIPKRIEHRIEPDMADLESESVFRFSGHSFLLVRPNQFLTNKELLEPRSLPIGSQTG